MKKNIMIRNLLIIIFITCYIVGFNKHASSQQKNLVAHGGYSFETNEGQSATAVYISFFNNSDKTYQIKSVSTNIADKAEIHDIKIKNDVVKMELIQTLEINPGEQIFLQPGGKHIMLFGLKKKLEEGDKFLLSFLIDEDKSLQAEIFIVDNSLRERYIN